MADDWKKRLKKERAKNRKKKLEQGKPWRKKGFRGSATRGSATRRALSQSGPAKRGPDSNACSMCGKKVSRRNQHESISGSPLCKQCAESRERDKE